MYYRFSFGIILKCSAFYDKIWGSAMVQKKRKLGSHETYAFYKLQGI